jgi:hypothetical protein
MHILSPTRESNLNGSNQAERLHQRYLAKFAQKMNDLSLFSFGALPFRNIRSCLPPCVTASCWIEIVRNDNSPGKRDTKFKSSGFRCISLDFLCICTNTPQLFRMLW